MATCIPPSHAYALCGLAMRAVHAADASGSFMHMQTECTTQMLMHEAAGRLLGCFQAATRTNRMTCAYCSHPLQRPGTLSPLFFPAA